RAKLRAVVEYIEEHLDANPTLEQMAAVARLSPYHFARQFKAATGLPPHQYVIARRVERAQHLLQGGGHLSLAEVAVLAGFSDQSRSPRPSKRPVAVTPGKFRPPERIVKKAASPAKKRQSDPLTIPQEQRGSAGRGCQSRPLDSPLPPGPRRSGRLAARPRS